MVYIWWFPCLDYSFNILTSRISNFVLYNWFYHIYFTCYFLTCSCMPILMTRFSIHAPWLGFIDTRVLVLARHLAHTTHWGVLTPLDLHVQILELGAYGFSDCRSEMRRESVNFRQTVWSPILPGLPAHLLSFSFVTREHLLYCS